MGKEHDDYIGKIYARWENAYGLDVMEMRSAYWHIVALFGWSEAARIFIGIQQPHPPIIR